MSNEVALAFCVHHKPWLMMSTLITVMAQRFREFDISLLAQKGDGSCLNRDGYDDYHELARQYGSNRQLSAYDRRVDDICNVRGHDLVTIDYDNDHLLDSGAWLKFMRDGHWKRYRYIICMQEGNLCTNDRVLDSMLSFARERNVHFLSAGHEKRRLPRSTVESYNTQKRTATPLDRFHDEKIRETFELFCRDETFRDLYDNWGDDVGLITQNHVPDVVREPFLRRMRSIGRTLRDKHELPVFRRSIHENTYRRPLGNVVDQYFLHENTAYHRADDLEWFGCSCQHLFSHEFLTRLSEEFDDHRLYDIMDVPFAGSAMEIIWGFLPKWLGFEKWFFDGFHRVRKNHVTYEREDDCPGMCSYINSYFKGILRVVPDGEYVRIERIHPDYSFLRNILTKEYFGGATAREGGRRA